MKTILTKIILGLALTLIAATSHAVNKSERILIVVSELQQHGPQNLRGLYEALEELTRFQTNIILHDDYKNIIHLRKADATVAKFKTLLRHHSSRADVKAIDVVMSLHGASGKLYFREGGVRVSSLVETVLQATSASESAAVALMKSKLRMIYNLSCFGRSHNQAFRDMGFDVSVGSNGINANSEVEFTSVLTAWSFGSAFQGAFNATNNDAALAVADGAVRLTGIPADSRKYFRGETDLNITTSAR